MLTLSDYQAEVARAYDLAPLYTDRDVQCWHALAEETDALYDKVTQLVDVIPVFKSEPYPDAKAMLQDIAAGRLLVSNVNHTHPVWTPEQNLRFRAVHDIVGHGTSGSGFDWLGELKAWEAHESVTTSLAAKEALFTEAVGQVAWALQHGGFGPQKVARLPQWLRVANVEGFTFPIALAA